MSKKPWSNVRFTCADGSFVTGSVTVDGKPIYGVTSAEYTLANGNLGVLKLTIDGVPVDLVAQHVDSVDVIERKICRECGEHQ